MNLLANYKQALVVLDNVWTIIQAFWAFVYLPAWFIGLYYVCNYDHSFGFAANWDRITPDQGEDTR